MPRVLDMSVLRKIFFYVPGVLNMLGLEYTRVVNVSKLYRVLC